MQSFVYLAKMNIINSPCIRHLHAFKVVSFWCHIGPHSRWSQLLGCHPQLARSEDQKRQAGWNSYLCLEVFALRALKSWNCIASSLRYNQVTDSENIDMMGHPNYVHIKKVEGKYRMFAPFVRASIRYIANNLSHNVYRISLIDDPHLAHIGPL